MICSPQKSLHRDFSILYKEKNSSKILIHNMLVTTFGLKYNEYSNLLKSSKERGRKFDQVEI